MELFYRFIDIRFENGPRIHKKTFKLVRETPCGYWIVPTNPDPISIDEWIELKLWVSKSGRKRYAYPSEELALESFIARKRAQIRILTAQLERAKIAWEKGIMLRRIPSNE